MIKLVVGLGNPGRRYDGTRHNVGFKVIDRLVEGASAKLRKSWWIKGQTARIRLRDQNISLLKPSTFMNRSGQAVAPFLRKHGLAPEDLLVIVDDLDLELGRLRIRKQGGEGGHNGLRSIIQALGSETFARLRIGIGCEAEPGGMVDHVLSRFRPEEMVTIQESIARAAEAVEDIIDSGLDRAMNEYN